MERGRMKVSNCCGALFYEPGWPDNDLCSACKEHADAIDQEEPSIVVVDMPTETEESKKRMLKILKDLEQRRA